MKRFLPGGRPALTMLAALAAAPALANPGLLHKHARSLGAPMALPGQASAAVTTAAGGATPIVTTMTLPAADGSGVVTTAVGIATVGTVASGNVSGSASGGSGVVAVAPGILPVPIDAMAIDPGMKVDGGPVCIMMPIDGGPVPIDGTASGGPVHVHHRLAPGAVGGAFGADGLPVDGVVDPGFGDSGPVTIMPFPVDAIPLDGTADGVPAPAGTAAPAGFFHAWRRGPGSEGVQPLATATMNATALTGAAPTDAATASATARAGGLPARAAGVRGEAVAEMHRHRPAAALGTAAAAGTATAAGDGGSSTPSGASTVAAGVARAGVTPTGAGASGAATAPRWRDRLRIAWPGAK